MMLLCIHYTSVPPGSAAIFIVVIYMLQVKTTLANQIGQMIKVIKEFISLKPLEA